MCFLGDYVYEIKIMNLEKPKKKEKPTIFPFSTQKPQRKREADFIKMLTWE